MLPKLSILIIEDAPDLLEQIHTGITDSIDHFDRSDIDINVLQASSVSEALQLVNTDGDIQAVIFSWDTTVNWEEITPDQQGKIANNSAVIDAIKAIRLELPVYVLGDAIKGLEIIDQASGVEAFFYRNDIITDPESILGYIINDFNDRSETPFWTAYKEPMTPGIPPATAVVPVFVTRPLSVIFIAFLDATYLSAIYQSVSIP